MSLKINSKAPDFSLKDTEGNLFRLSKEISPKGHLILFYPKAFTPGCTKEVCRFSEDYGFFSSRGIGITGISHDSPETLKSFKERYHLPFALLSDPGRVVCRQYNAVYPFGLLTKRISYFIDGEGIIRHISDNLMNPDVHLSQAMRFIENRKPDSSKEELI
jgi:peroxiredoxin Q/BCP